MPKEQTIEVRCIKTVKLKDGSKWTCGLTYITTESELARRGVPKDAYKVIGDSAKITSPTTDASPKA